MKVVLETVVPSLVKAGIFGEVKFVNLQPEDEIDIGPQFASSLSFFKLTVEGSSGEEVFPLLLKLPISDLEKREARNCDVMFHNEVTMYKEILPSLGLQQNWYPRIYYAISSEGVKPESNLLIMENLKYKDFVLSRKRFFLDFSHISLAIKKIAEFHSFSYKLKHENKDKFIQITKMLKKIVLPKSIEEEYGAFGYAAMARGIKPLVKNGIGVNVLKKCLSFLKCPEKLKKFISLPEEPFAVICHGDFCNNNILYKYDKSDEPIDCVFFDFQLSQYASPAIDLFFFLYMHTTSSFREKYWDDIIKAYWDTLRHNLPDHIDIPTFEEYLKHFAKRAIYGYIICSWFIPMLTDSFTITMDEYKSLNLEGKVEAFMNIGEEESEKIISEVVLHLLNKNYINDFVDFCNEQHFKC